jgi:hypothetical protein
MSARKVSVHLGGKNEVCHFDLAEEQTLTKIASELAKLHFGGCKPEELFFFEEDSEGEELAALVIVGEKPTHHIHCHRCKHAHVSVIFGAETKTHSFRPGERLRKVIEWAKSDRAFKLDKGSEYVLRLGGVDTDALNNDAHVGNFVQHGTCSATFYLTPPCRIQG